MPNSRQAGAYPSLIPGNQQGAADPNSPWDVIELDDEARNAAGGIGPSTNKHERILKVPKVILRHDWWIRYHELTHVERPQWEPSKNGLRNTMRAMLEEVALDGQCLLRDGIDLRQARDFYDWSQYPQPRDVYQAAAVYFQIYTSAQITKDKALSELWLEIGEQIGQAEAAEPKLTGLADTLQQAAEAVFNDYSSGNCEDWADIVTAKLLGIKKEEIPNAPSPYSEQQLQTGSTPGRTGDGTSDSSEADDGSPTGGGTQGSSAVRPGPRGGDEDTCEACEGEGVDEDGDECPACGGTGEGDTGEGSDTDQTGTPGSGKRQPEAGDEGEGEAGDGDQDDRPGQSYSDWDTPPVPLDKGRQNDPMEFSADPLGKSEMDPHKLPPERNEAFRERQTITDEQLQEEIDRERMQRRGGEVSLAPEITARTPHGNVDVHRHVLNQGTSISVALAWRSSQDGSTIRYPSQMYPDGRVFAKRAPGGSIILDCSGSMDWHAQIITEAQKKMPNLYVAGYSSHGSNGYWRASHSGSAPDTFIARYCVLAAKGKLDTKVAFPLHQSEAEHTGGNSGADPASLWYAVKNAPKPIVWVSDGMVSFGEKQEFWRQCDAIMRQHKIVRVLTIEDAIDYLLGKAVPGWHQCATVDVRWVRPGQPHMGSRVDPKSTMSEAQRWAKLRANSRRR